MKKVLAISVLLVYFTVSTGFVVSFHYCMSQLASTGISLTESQTTCDDCGMENGEGHCCWDDVKVVKLQAEHFASIAKWNLDAPPIVLQPTPLFALSVALLPCKGQTFYTDTSPPLGHQDIYLRNRVFRI